MSGEPWCPIPIDPDPVCSNCGEPGWSDVTASCSVCGDTIFDVSERIAAERALERAQAIRDHRTQGGPE